MSIHLRLMRGGEEQALSALVIRAFHACVAPDYSARGIATFTEFATAPNIAERAARGHFTLVAECDLPQGRRRAGVLQLRPPGHLLMLFVDPACHGRGVGRALVHRALLQLPGALATVTVNASPFSVPFYARLGFASTGPLCDAADGVRVVPMRLVLPPRVNPGSAIARD